MTNVQTKLQQIMADMQLDDAPAGGCLLVCHKGGWVVNTAVGLANCSNEWNANTLSLNFSAGKGVLVTLVHVLVSNGLLDYDKPISNYWQAFATNGKQHITLRQVLSHQANLFALHGLVDSQRQAQDWEFMLGVVANMAVQQPIGLNQQDGSAYSALVFGWVLGGLIEKVTQLSLQQALQKYLTEPLNIQDEVFFELPQTRFVEVAQPVRNFDVGSVVGGNKSDQPIRRSKPTLKPDSHKTLATYASLPCYPIWQNKWQKLAKKPIDDIDNIDNDKPLTTADINNLYFDMAKLNIKNYTMALMANAKEHVDYYQPEYLLAKMPAVNCVASAKGLATIYDMLANGGKWQDANKSEFKTIIDETTFKQLSTVQVTGQDAVMPAKMEWRLGYHKLFSACYPSKTAFGHIGYNGAYAWCDPAKNLAMAYVHNYDVTMLTDIRALALTEAVLEQFNTNGFNASV